jgi:hypothetical protein
MKEVMDEGVRHSKANTNIFFKDSNRNSKAENYNFQNRKFTR